MNLRININRNGVWRAAASTSWDKHFQNPEHKFKEHAKFTIIEKINNEFPPKKKTKSFTTQRRFLDTWLDTLSPKGLPYP